MYDPRWKPSPRRRRRLSLQMSDDTSVVIHTLAPRDIMGNHYAVRLFQHGSMQHRTTVQAESLQAAQVQAELWAEKMLEAITASAERKGG